MNGFESIPFLANRQRKPSITDDRSARTAASSLGLKCIGLLGVLVLAKQRNQLSSVKSMIAALGKLGGLYLSDAGKAEAVRFAGE